ncbi:MAG: glycoside hydrolase family 2, partial [Phocaeicola sp.]|nr:glycoside hydrolase family 2 [Phocaeicola sp.]
MINRIIKRLICFTAISGALAFLPSPAFAQSGQLHRVAVNDCGVPGAQPFLVKGENYTMPDYIKGSKEAVTCNFGSKVIYAFNHMDIHADYRLEVVFLADHERQQHIVVDGNEIQAPITLEAGKEQRYLIDLPRKAYAYSQLVLVFEGTGKGANAIVSELNLYSSNPKAPVPFEGEEKRALINVQTYKVDTDVDVEKVLPIYTVVPQSVTGVYQSALSLNGDWMFNPRPDKEFYKQPLSGQWKTIVVPGQWSMQGYKVDSTAFAGYYKTFTLPEDWKGCQIKLRFDGVHSEYHVYLNGTEIGYHLGGMTAYEIDITRHVKAGSNELALAVRSESLADMLGSLTQYAAHQLGGITRKVTLFAVPASYVSDMRITTDLDRNYEDAALNVQTAVTNATGRMQDGLRLRLSIDGLPNVMEKRLPSLAAGETWRGVVSDSVIAPILWNNERPQLYQLKMELCDGENIIETIEKRFGFREIEIRGNELLVNGQPVKLRGVCRHEMHPLTGRVMTEELERRDVELYRGAN